MNYAIVGFGKIGQALAHAFARKNIKVTVASRRPPEALAPQLGAIGPAVVAKSLQDAVEADTIILAVPFWEQSRGCEGPAKLERQDCHRRDETRLEFRLRSWTASHPPPSLRRRSLAPGS